MNNFTSNTSLTGENIL